jgi:protein phosphatase/serine/threonine-protein phosphatase Stp1
MMQEPEDGTTDGTLPVSGSLPTEAGTARVSACTHPGTVRTGNEDAFLAHATAGLWLVADGAGGHGAGEIASQAAAQSLADLPEALSAAEVLLQIRLRLTAVHENLQKRSLAEGRPRPMATTVLVLVLRGTHYAALWAGDSRLYLWRGGRLQRLTRDHSLVQELVDAGALSEAEAEHHPQSNIITRAIGSEGELLLDKISDRLEADDQFLLCSDGLYRALPDQAIAALLAQGATAEVLVEAALRAAARDNVTAVLVAARSQTTEAE